MARARDHDNGLSEVADAWRHSATKISADLARTIRDAREAAEQLSDAVRSSAEGVTETAMLRTREGADAVQTSVRRHPIAWLAGAAGVGALIGLVLASSRR